NCISLAVGVMLTNLMSSAITTGICQEPLIPDRLDFHSRLKFSKPLCDCCWSERICKIPLVVPPCEKNLSLNDSVLLYAINSFIAISTSDNPYPEASTAVLGFLIPIASSLDVKLATTLLSTT